MSQEILKSHAENIDIGRGLEAVRDGGIIIIIIIIINEMNEPRKEDEILAMMRKKCHDQIAMNHGIAIGGTRLDPAARRLSS